MTRVKRSVRIAVALLMVASLVAATWVYQTIYRSSDFALRHAEAFRFRRMTVAQVGERGTYQYFFVTNRREERSDGPIEERFGRERSGAFSVGSFEAKIEPSLGLGMLINPSEWFRDEEIVLKNIQQLEPTGFVTEVRQLVDESPYRALMIVVHGYRERFPSALRKTAFFGHVLDANVPVLAFDWPGNQGSSLAGYRRAREVATESGADFARALELIIDRVQPDKLWIVANSMGAQVVVDGFGLLHRKPEFSDDGTEIDEVVLTAPDVDHAAFDERFKHEISALANSLTVYVSSNDRALVLSRLVNRERRRGESTLTPDQFDEAVRLSALTEADSDLVTLVDVTPVNRTRNFHNFSLETPEFFDDLFLRLTNEQPPRSRLLYRVETADGRIYHVLTRGR